MRPKFSGLWRHPDFMKLWAGETISVFGSQITFLALPLTGVLVLNASPTEMGILAAVEFAPFLFLSLFAGVWVDRLRRRPILITADLGRAGLLGLIPIAAALNILSMPLLYVIALFIGVLTVFFDVAYQSYLPSLVEREQLVEGNSKLEVTRSLAQVAGPGIAGVLVQLITAPFAIIVDGISFLVSGVFVGWIHKAEPPKVVTETPKNVWREIGEGLGVIFGSRYLRSIAGCTGSSNLFSNIGQAVFTIYVIRELKLEPGILGLIFGVGSFGGILGALVANRVAQRFGLGWTIIGTAFLGGIGGLLIPLLNGPIWLVIIFLILGSALTIFGGTVYNINQVSLRQAITPHRLQGRMNASMRFMVWGTMPIGSLIGGFLGDSIGLRPTLWVGAIGGTLAFLFVLLSPVRSLREQPTPVEEEERVSAPV